MRIPVTILMLGAVLFASYALRADETATQEQKKKTVVKLQRKANRAGQATPKPDRSPAPADDAQSPPVLFEQEPKEGHDDHEHHSGELDQDLLDTVKRLLQGPEQEHDGEAKHPLQRVGERMRQAENRIARIDAGRETQRIQTGIVNDLDALIAQLKQQASQCPNCKGAGCPQCQQLGGKKQGQPKPQQPNNSGKPGNKPGDQRSADAARQAGKATPKEVAMQRQADLLKSVWGQLPMRLRDKLEQMSQQVFLPRYETLIERYFESLAEQESDSSAPSRR